MWRVFVVILAALACLGEQSSAQPAAGTAIDYWAEPVGEGKLPQNTVTAILQTRDGYLWLGTELGLVRSDGIQFVIFDSHTVPALHDVQEHVTCLVEDGEGALWIGTKQGGVVRLKEGKFTLFGAANGLTDMNVSALCLDSEGRVWVGTRSGGLFQFRDGEFTSYPVLRDYLGHQVKALVTGTRGRIWVATGNQFGILEDGELHFLADKPAARSDTVSIGTASGGGVWVVYDGRLWKYDDQGQLVRDCGAFLPGGDAGVEVTSVYEEARGERLQVWIGTTSRGLYRYADDTFNAVKDDKEERRYVMAVRGDRDGNIWVGTRGAKVGLHRLKERLIDVLDRARGLDASVVTSVCESHNGGLWIGTDGGGLHRLKDGAVRRFPLEGSSSDRVWAVLEDTQTNLWVGTERGLYRVTDGTQTNYGLATLSLSIRALYEDTRSNIWVGTLDAGVSRISPDGSKHYSDRDGLAHNDVRAIQDDGKGSIWIATAQGLSRLKDGAFSVVRATNGLPSDLVRTLYAEPDGPLWVGTGRGLACLNQGRWTSFNTRGGALPDDIISQIIDDGRSNLWIGSNKGIFRLKKWELLGHSKNGSQAFSRVLYGTSDGLKTPECNGGFQPSGAKTLDGKLCFPTLDGLAMVDLANVRQNDRPPNVLIESFVVDGKFISLDGPIRLPPGGGRYEFAYTGFNFSAPRLLRFRYMLEGKDPDWVDGGSGRLAVYNLLPPGNYTFKLIAGNEDGTRWNELGKSVAFTILSPFWRTSWFRAVAAMLFIALALSAYRFITVLQLERRLRELEQLQALERERARIAKDVHDDLGARLTQIGIIGELIRRDAEKPATAELAGKLTRATREVSESVDEIVWAVNPRNDTLDRLVPYLLHYAEDYLEPTPIRYRLDAPTKLPPQPIKSDARHNLFLVIKEALNNAVKHAQATELRLELTFEKSVLTVHVQDNGAGFELNDANPMGNGLSNMRRRIEDIGGTFTLTSAPGKGTAITVTLRLK